MAAAADGPVHSLGPSGTACDCPDRPVQFNGPAPGLASGQGPCLAETNLIRSLNLAEFDAALAKGKWQAHGVLSGQALFGGSGSRLEQVHVELEAQPPGGELSSQFLQDLLGMMPQGDVRRKLLSALAQKAMFHFNVGRLKVATEGENLLFSLFLDGDHLLDINIRVPRDSAGLLANLL